MTTLPDAVYREAFRNIDIPALISDTNFVIQDVNPAGREFTGYTYDEMVGESVVMVAGDEEVYANIVDTVVDGEVWSGDFELRTKEGRTVFGSGSAAPITVDGELQGFLAVFVNMTKRRQLENTVEVLNRVLRHDLKNDLNVLYGYIQQAQTRAANGDSIAQLEDAKDKLTEVISKSERARDLRQLLERTYEEQNRPTRLDYVLNDTIVDMISEFEDAEFHFKDFPPIPVVADNLLSIVFETIIENAVVHNDKPTPVVEISVEERETTVVIRIADNGPGVPEQETDVIFGREEIDQLHHGSGISLFFADSVIESYNGDIWVERNDPAGSVFTIELLKA